MWPNNNSLIPNLLLDVMKQNRYQSKKVIIVSWLDSFTKDIDLQALLAALVIGGLIITITVVAFQELLQWGLMIAVGVSTGIYLLIQHRGKVLRQELIILLTMGLIPFLQLNAFIVGIFLLVLLITVDLRDLQQSP